MRLAISIAVCALIARTTSDISKLARRADCTSIDRSQPIATRIKVCQEEFDRTADPNTGALLAADLVWAGELERATRIATSLVSTSARPDALGILGNIAMNQGRLEDAVVLLEEARFLHRFMQQPLDLARDDAVLASVRTERSEFLDALQLLNECISATNRRYKFQECHCHTVAARTLVSLGYFDAAEQELRNAKATAEDEDAHIQIEYQIGNLAQEAGNQDLAVAKFEDVLNSRQRLVDMEQTIITEENLAYSLAELGTPAQLEDAQRHLERATRLDRDHKQTPGRTWTAARIAFGRRDFTKAASLVTKYFELVRDDESATTDDQIDVASLGAQIELARNQLVEAEAWARRAVDAAESIRTQTIIELRPWILIKRRKAYELLFLAIARAGRIEDAAIAFNQWQGRTVHDALAQPGPRAPLDPVAVAEQIIRLRRWAATSRTLFSAPAAPAAVLNTLRHVDLLAVIVAGDEVWRLAVDHGSLQLSPVGELDKIRNQVVKLASHPTAEAQEADALGLLLVPDSLFRETLDTLYVVIDSRLAMLPPAGLHHAGIPLGVVRPIARSMRLPDTPCVHLTRSGHKTVLGDPDNSLPAAKLEVQQVAALLGTTGMTGSAATKAAVLAAGGDAVLHVAAHTNHGKDGAAIALAGGELPALEIAAQPVGPSLAVLSECNAAVTNVPTLTQDDPKDVEVVDSLATAFLIAGSQHVVAPLRSVTDAGTLEVISAFYGAGAVGDPVRALHFAQSQLSTTRNTDWPLFVVFGSDVCIEGPAPHR